MRRKIVSFVSIALLLVFMCGVAFAGTPLNIIQTTTDKVLSILSNKSAGKSSMRTRIKDAIEDKFDFTEISKRTLAIHWKRISNSERQQFVPLFKKLLENVYLSKVEQYADTTVDVKIKYLDERIEGKYAMVSTSVRTSTATDTPIQYKLLKTSKGWKIYDIKVEGISLVKNYRSQFHQILGSGKKPFSYLLNAIEKKNAKYEKK